MYGLAAALILGAGCRRLAPKRQLLCVSISALTAAVTVVYFALSPMWTIRQVVVVVLVVLWGAHQTYWLNWLRFARQTPGGVTTPEVPVLKSAGKIFLASAPMLAVMVDGDNSWTIVDGIAALLFGIGAYFSEGGFRQLRRFMAAPGAENSVLQAGLWSITRQPHYFGECMMIASFYIFALSTENGMVTIFAPILAMNMIRHVLVIDGSELAMLRDIKS